jgi:hypothetical protein
MTKQPGRPRDAAKELMWREMVRRQAQSGLTVRAFCDEHMLDEGAFFTWRRRLATLDAAQGRRTVRAPAVKNGATRPSAFTQVRLEAALGADDVAVEIVVEGRERVRVKPGFDRATLAAVLDVLENRSC